MSEALATIEVPTVRPPGVTPKQWRLAAIYPRAENAYQALIAAGYKPSTALAKARRTSESVGVKRATEALQVQQRDRAGEARGLAGIGKLALTDAKKDLADLEPRDRIAAGFKAYELAASLGENIEATGDGDAWKQRLRRACRLMARLTEARLRRPQHMDINASPKGAE
jgi:hypothetical protein